MAKFKQEVLAEIRRDADLFAKVAKATGIEPGSLRGTIDKNGRTLNQYHVVVVVASHLGRDPEDVIEEETELQK